MLSISVMNARLSIVLLKLAAMPSRKRFMEGSSFGSMGLTFRGACSVDGCAMLYSRPRIVDGGGMRVYDLATVASETGQALGLEYTFCKSITS